MRKFVMASFMTAVAVILGTPVFAQGMMWGRYDTDGTASDVSQTAQDETAGRTIFLRLKDGSVDCSDLKDDDFDLLGDYYMRAMVGDTASHDAMNRTMAQRLGEDGEKQMHVAMGKRLSGCDPAAAVPTNAGSYWPMMYGGMMSGGGMMGRWGFGDLNTETWHGISGGPSILWGLSMLLTLALVWTVLILAILALLKWIRGSKK